MCIRDRYRNEDLHKLIAGLQYFFKCTKNGNVVSLNDDSKLIFEDVTKNDYNVRDFKFAYIEIELNDFLRASECVC